MTEQTFAALQARRRRYVESARENDFEEGLRNLLSELYPDTAHFIYELLQNAEDAGAKHVSFDLADDRLVFEHDGTRAFTLRDVDAITSIGSSPKKDDDTKIGKFGVGFKSVFAYTETPTVRSGDYCFAIHDLFVPETIPGNSIDGKTIFEFPFNRPDKPAAVARQEIMRGLDELGMETLLFLNEIQELTFSADEAQATIRRDDGATATTISKIDANGSKSMQWLRLVGSAKVRGHKRELPIAIAFQLGPASPPGASKGAEELRVVPAEPGTVSIFFPAAKETSGLRFHIHAPFASTVARDSVRDAPENDILIDAIGELLRTELPRLHAEGYLDDGLLAALPNDQDPLTPRYRRIYDAVASAFLDESICPKHGGGFAKGRQLVRSPVQFRKGMTPADLTFFESLFDEADSALPDEFAGWIAVRDGHAGRLLSGLETPEYGWDDLATAVRAFDEDENGPLWAEWIAAKNEKAARRLYEALGSDDAWDVDWLDELPIVRVNARGGVKHVTGKEAHLPATRSDKAIGRVPIELAYFDDKKSLTAGDADLRQFYQRVGTQRWDEEARVRKALGRYRPGSFPEQDGVRHRQDIQLFADFATSNPNRARSLMANVAFLSGFDRITDRYVWCAPSDLYLDHPYADTGLDALADQDATWQCRRLDSSYLDIPRFVDFATTVGVVAQLKIVQASPWENSQYTNSWNLRGTRWTSQGRKVDWRYEHLDAVLESKEPRLLRALWVAVCAAPASQAEAVFQLNGSADMHRMRSQIAQALEATPWVLDRHGALHVPADMTVDELPDGWPHPKAGRLISAIGFGERADIQIQQRTARDLQIHELGLDDYSPDDLEYLRRHPDDVRALIAARREADDAAESRDATGQRAGSQRRMISYVEAEGDGAGGGTGVDTAENQTIDAAGVRRVLAFEESCGRRPVEMPHGNKGFDVESFAPDGTLLRRIEVKSTNGDWAERGVFLSGRQFAQALEDRTLYWLYVVSNAKDDEAAQLFRIPNPATNVERYGFDSGWKAIAEPDVERDEKGRSTASNTRRLLQKSPGQGAAPS